MGRGLRAWLENGTPSLVLAVLVLLGGIAYGVYVSKPLGQPTESVEAGPAVKDIPTESL